VYELLNNEITSAAAFVGLEAAVVGVFCAYPILAISKDKLIVKILFMFNLV
jgi:hypothetical protein